MRVGVVGLGRMGSIFAERLIAQGIEVFLWNRTPSITDRLVSMGGHVCSSPAEIAQNVDLCLISLANEMALESVYLGADGLLSGAPTGLHFIETSTVRPVFIEELGRRISTMGSVLIDAPVLGTLAPAREGRLLFVVGADRDALEVVLPVLDVLGRRIVHMGPVGAGTTMKLVVNSCLSVYLAAVGEALAMGESTGLEIEQMLDVLLDSAIGTPALRGKLPVISGSDATVSFDLVGARKDLAAVISTAAHQATPSKIAKAALSVFDDAVSAGFGQLDVGSVVNVYRKLSDD